MRAVRAALRLAALAGAGGLVAACASLRAPRPVEVIAPDSPCAQLRASYPSRHGLLVFAGAAEPRRTFPYCFPGVRGAGVLGYAFEVAVPRPGPVTFRLSAIRPATGFRAVVVRGTCAGDSTGERIERLGDGPSFRFDALAGAYCLTLVAQPQRAEDTWLTITVERP